MCWHQHWTLEHFASLNNQEREFWIQWENRRRKRVNDTIREATQGHKVYAETVTMQLILALLRNG